MRKTKIICTIGPACSNEETLEKMCLAGMNVARLNFSHGSHEEHKKRIEMLKNVRDRLGVPLAIMLDTKGPEYRIGLFADGKCEISAGQKFIFTTDDVSGDNTRVSVSYKQLAKELAPGDTILVNNGLLIFTVDEIKGNDIITTVVEGGVISDRKSMSFPGHVLKQEYLSKQDEKDIIFGIQNDIDFIACSFVSQRSDLVAIKNLLKKNGGENIELIAKIENRAGIDNIEDICDECSGVMIGRGDMGVEIPFEELPAIQKQIITKCRMLGKRVITATEMLESMITNPRPTRAEISDVANAVFDGSSAIMLSGETAAGKNPVLTVKTMSKIAEFTENSIHYQRRFRQHELTIKNDMDAVSHAVCGMAMDIGAKAIAVGSISGKTARMVSRFRPPIDIVGLSVNKKTYHQLAMSWGVVPVMCEIYPSIEVLFYNASRLTANALGLNPGDKIVISGGTKTGESGQTNTIRIDTVQ